MELVMTADELAAVVNRLHRAQDRITGVIAMIEQGRDREEVVTRLAAASRALDGAGAAVIATGLRRCLSEEAEDGDRTGAADRERTRTRPEKPFLSPA